jgi:formylglycine-generating enzyme required for sulfatase activity
MDHPTAGATYGTAYLIPTENEWYKAAYHKNDGVTGAYFRYPTSSSTAPGRAMADPLPGNNANYFGSPYPIDSGKHTTVAGEFQNSASPYGTFDQGGNVLEWNETQNGSWRGLRGGSFLYGSADLASSSRSGDSPTYEDSFVGFRVAAVPEPGSLALLATVGLAGLVWRRKRARKVVRRRPAPPT